MFVITRVARNNPSIKGRTLYLSTSGLWTLEKSAAKTFKSRLAAGRTRATLKKTLLTFVEPFDA